MKLRAEYSAGSRKHVDERSASAINQILPSQTLYEDRIRVLCRPPSRLLACLLLLGHPITLHMPSK